MPISNYIRSWLMLTPMFPSILIILFNLYHFIGNQTLRRALNNHVIILLLICSFIEQVTDVAWQSHYYRTGTALISTPIFCGIWTFSGGAFYSMIYILMAWASFERHILIFHPSWFATKTKRLFFHYFPLSGCIIWPLIFYSLSAFILPCDVAIRYDNIFCDRYICSSDQYWPGLIDSFGHYIGTAFMTIIFNIALFGRVLYSRYKVHRSVDWRKHKKIAFQLLPLSMLYLFLQLPPMTLYAAYSAGATYVTANDFYDDSLFFTYWIVQFMPLACAISLPGLKEKCKNCLLFWRRDHRINPQAVMWTNGQFTQSARIALEAQ
ncbi:unnamed protein product [Adineta ricciae]|uniref:Uncharacterized protein n=1 Tax=Adineta ricciae TaxID=249248 RepID=A0A815VEE1_ADIRI|nr:unnamed protein product [Adineta ricciae]